MVLCGGNNSNISRGTERQVFFEGSRVSIQSIRSQSEIGLKRQPGAGGVEFGRSWVSLPANLSHVILSFRIRWNQCRGSLRQDDEVLVTKQEGPGKCLG